jgi:hypothetical protein
MKHLLGLIFIAFSAITLYADTYTYEVEGEWKDQANWDGYPGQTIASTDTVIVNANLTTNGAIIINGIIINNEDVVFDTYFWMFTINGQFINNGAFSNSAEMLVNGEIINNDKFINEGFGDIYMSGTSFFHMAL